jgi:thiol-disulfide isomerase/thioredoxin
MMARMPRRACDRFVLSRGRIALGLLAVVPCVCATSASSPGRSVAPLRPGVSSPSIQEIMQTTIDPAADEVWGAVASITTKAGTDERRPQSPAEWAAARNSAVRLVQAARLLTIAGRPVASRGFPAEAKGALNSTRIQHLIAQQRPAFGAFATALGAAATTAIAAIDAEDAAALTRAGSTIEEICEACHLRFWYPHQVIPSFPREHDPRRPIAAIGVQAPAFFAPAPEGGGKRRELAVGEPLREATLRGLNGRSRRLSDFRGRPLLINVWASWCGPCRREVASLERLAWLDQNRKFAIIGISTDDDAGQANAWIAQSHATISQFIDVDREMESMLGASRIPLTVLVGADGRLIARIYGAREWDSPGAQRLIAGKFR